ncbi:MAG: GxxExxY protein [Candidatus Zapsychrus exili]|nr:GxxExxY protein [Candidatus Zapsychrus exili]
MINDHLTKEIIGCCYQVYNKLGPGFSEKIYHNALVLVLEKDGLKCIKEKDFSVYFDNEKVGSFRLDLIVEDKVIVEVKALAKDVPPIFRQQIVSYLKAAKLKVGLLVNFGDKSCFVKRFVC